MHRVGTPAERRARVDELLDAVRLRVVVRRPAAARALRRPAAAGRAGPRAGAATPAGGRRRADQRARRLGAGRRARAVPRPCRSSCGFSCLFISHDLAVVHEVAHRVGVLRAGELVEVGDADRVFRRPEHPYTQRLVDAVPVPDPASASGRGPARPGWRRERLLRRRWASRPSPGGGGHGPVARAVPARARAPRGQGPAAGAGRGVRDGRPLRRGLRRRRGDTRSTRSRLPPYLIDETAVTNAQFARFVRATDHVTEAEEFGVSAVFHLVVDAPRSDVLHQVAAAPWWVAVKGRELEAARGQPVHGPRPVAAPGRPRLVARRPGLLPVGRQAAADRGRVGARRPRRAARAPLRRGATS